MTLKLAIRFVSIEKQRNTFIQMLQAETALYIASLAIKYLWNSILVGKMSSAVVAYRHAS